MLERIALASIRHRLLVATLFVVLLVAGVLAGRSLKIDALPDVSSVQIDVLTTVPGGAPLDVERTVTFPIENALNGVPGASEIRSVSRFGLSAVTVVFKDGTSVWFARQVVLERLRGLEGALPKGVGAPELAPVTTGLGTIYKFVVASEQHSAMQLRTILDWEIVPKLRGVRGVIEVNTFGGELKQYEVRVERPKLAAVGLSLEDVIAKLRSSNDNVGGGYLERRGEAFVIRGEGLLTSEADIEDVVLKAAPGQPPVLVRHVAEVGIGAALRQGVVTYDGKGEAVSGLVLMLAGSNSRDVVTAVKAKMRDIERSLPPGVRVEVIYDRGDFVERTLTTVATNLLEGVLVVTVVLALLLGTIRGALVVALGIPGAMSIALLGMHAFDITGDLMSLGAIDFGFLVDGPIVLLEGIIAAVAGKDLVKHARAEAYGAIAGRAVTPIAFSVAIIMLVYVPLLALEGVEGKMFRPMALTMACALFGGLLYAVVFFPALVVLFVAPPGHAKWVHGLEARARRVIDLAIRARIAVLAGAGAAFVGAVALLAGAGAEFVPRIFEGDAVIAIKRSPSIGLDEARRLDLLAEKIVLSYPECKLALGQTGRAELAIDAVGNDNTDLLVALRPVRDWKTTRDFDTLSELLKDRLESEVPGTFVAVSQPIEDLTNQLIAGSRADVSIKVFGPDLERLVEISTRIGERIAKIEGKGDLFVERLMGQPMISAKANRARMARYGVSVDAAFHVLEASRAGVHVGDVYDAEKRFQLRVLDGPEDAHVGSLGDLFVEASAGGRVPLREVLDITEGDGPYVIKRLGRERLVRIDVNLRGRDLVSFVNEARDAVAKDVALPPGYRVAWGGQFENFERAARRLALVVPAVVAIIVGMLLLLFRNGWLALAVFSMVPLSMVGGAIGLVARGMPFSLPAAIGFIALGGVSVLNGVVITMATKAHLTSGVSLDEAVTAGAAESVRAVLTTGAVAAFGFLPMMLSRGAGSEVQRPLATIVVTGIVLATGLAVVVFPVILRVTLAIAKSVTALVEGRRVRIEP